jgi:hypothetical protein
VGYIFNPAVQGTRRIARATLSAESVYILTSGVATRA